VDGSWRRFSAGGKEVQCGRLNDKYGVSWQIVPAILGELLSSKEPEESQRVMRV
jgi:predicted 3-demethylubiquinone-9 3-methyltransferase (glyoxalase superfamily)